MAQLTRWDPFRDMMSMRRTMDRVMDRMLDEDLRDSRSIRWALPLDVSETEDEYIIKASVPGMDPEDLDITLVGDTLTIKGEKTVEREEKEETRYHLRERRTGQFSRTITLPEPVKSEDTEAHYENGELTLRLPKAEDAKPKRISVRSEPSKKVIEGQLQGNGRGKNK